MTQLKKEQPFISSNLKLRNVLAMTRSGLRVSFLRVSQRTVDVDQQTKLTWNWALFVGRSLKRACKSFSRNNSKRSYVWKLGPFHLDVSVPCVEFQQRILQLSYENGGWLWIGNEVDLLVWDKQKTKRERLSNLSLTLRQTNHRLLFFFSFLFFCFSLLSCLLLAKPRCKITHILMYVQLQSDSQTLSSLPAITALQALSLPRYAGR